MSAAAESPRPASARETLARLPERGVDWPRRLELPDTSAWRPAAVLALFGVLDDVPARTEGPLSRDVDVLLLRRASTLGSHAGQIAFPGGRVDAEDSDHIAAALREAEEETGVDRAGIDVLGALPTLPVPASKHLVTPVLAWWTTPSPVGVVDVGETEHVFRAPVAELIHPDRRAVIRRDFNGRPFTTPAFDLGDGLLVWGFTALVLDGILEAAGWTEPWDTERVIPLPGEVTGRGPGY